MAKFIEFSSTDQLNEALAAQVITRLRQAIEQKGQASMVISGGRTPQGLFQLLNKEKLDWKRVFITLADERWVDADDDASNEKTVRKGLLINEAKSAQFISLKNRFDDPFEGAPEIERTLKIMPMPFDVVILGMGEDGHTASLFPGAANLKPALDLNSGRLCLGMAPLTAPYERITLTLPTLLNCPQIFVHITGDLKKEVYQKAASGSDITEMPIRAVLLNQKNIPVDVYWAK